MQREATDLASDLIRFPSVSSASNVDICGYLEELLRGMAFTLERLTYEREKTTKVCLVARRGEGPGGFAFCGHTDVVPAEEWRGPGSGPFDPQLRDGALFGRGSCDMKGSLACMLSAISAVSDRSLGAPICLLLTSDEETGQWGAAEVAAHSALFQDMVRGRVRCVVGEPTLMRPVYAHKGTCLIRATAHGRAGHSGGREGLNANWAMIPFLTEVAEIHRETETDPRWCDSRFDPPTLSMNLGVNDFTQAVNVTPAQSVCTIFLRPMPGVDSLEVIRRIGQAAARNGLTWEIVRQEAPFSVPADSEYLRELLLLTESPSAATTNFGTDASRLTALPRLAIVGPGSITQAHTAHEFITLEQLQRGTQFFSRCLARWCHAHE